MIDKIKHSRKIVFAFISIPVLLLLLAMVFIAIRQNLLEKKYVYYSTLANAMGISTQTPLLYKGFEVGRVRDFSLMEDGNIGLEFYILNRYKNIMVTGSILARNTNPITGKTTLEFIQNPNSREHLQDKSTILSSDFPEGKKQLKLIAPQTSDPISLILANLAQLSSSLNEDYNADKGSIPRFLVNLADASEKANASMNKFEEITTELSILTANLNQDNNPESGVLLRTLNNLAELTQGLNNRMNELEFILASAQTAIDNYKKPDSLLIKLLDPEQDKILQPLSETLNNLESATAELVKILATVNNPELRLLLSNLNDSLAKARKTLEGLNNNPLLRKGISPSAEQNMPSPKYIHQVPNVP